jgi:hypothetical protein
MKISCAALVLLPATAAGFQISHPSSTTRSVGSLFASVEPGATTYDYAPNIAPDIMPMDLIHEEPAPAEFSDNEIGFLPGHEQTRFSGELLGMDTSYKAQSEPEVRFAPPHPPPGDVMKTFKAIKCYQTANGIYKQAKSYAHVITPQEHLDPQTFVMGV